MTEVETLCYTLVKLVTSLVIFLVASEGGARSITCQIEFCVPKKPAESDILWHNYVVWLPLRCGCGYILLSCH